MKNNPFTLMYGIESESVVSREDNINRIIESFTEQKNMYSYIITGLRGSGKTVLLKAVEKILEDKYKWIVLNINPQGDILASIAEKLYDLGTTRKIIGNLKLSVNLGVISLTRDSGEKTTNPEIIIEHILSSFALSKTKVLISIDEVNNTQEFKKFINFYQILIAKKRDIYLLMTALVENINALINDKAMTFLSRSPKIELKPLSVSSIALNYGSVFDIEKEEIVKMAKLTCGYAFAYQVLGYLMFESQKKIVDEELIKEYERYLWDNGYNKFWQDVTNTERKFLIAVASSDGSKEKIVENGFSLSNFSQYRKRLLDKGLIFSPKFGYLDFVLPRFKEYVLFMKLFE